PSRHCSQMAVQDRPYFGRLRDGFPPEVLDPEGVNKNFGSNRKSWSKHPVLDILERRTVLDILTIDTYAPSSSEPERHVAAPKREQLRPAVLEPVTRSQNLILQ